MPNYHILRLGPGRRSYFCPFTRLHLVAPSRAEGRLPFGANLMDIKKALASGGLIDVSGTIIGPNVSQVQNIVTGRAPSAKTPQPAVIILAKDPTVPDPSPQPKEVAPKDEKSPKDGKSPKGSK